MLNVKAKKTLLIVVSIAASILMLCSMLLLRNNQAIASTGQKCSNETIEEDTNPDVLCTKDAGTKRYWFTAESSKVQYDWFGQKFTSDTLYYAFKKADTDTKFPEEFWDDIYKQKPISFIIYRYKYIGKEAVTQEALNKIINDKDMKHKDKLKNGINLEELNITKPTWVEPHLEEENTICNISCLKHICVHNVEFGKHPKNIIGKGMPNLQTITTKNNVENYVKTNLHVCDIVSPEVQVGCKFDAYTDCVFVFNYEHYHHGNGNWTYKRI